MSSKTYPQKSKRNISSGEKIEQGLKVVFTILGSIPILITLATVSVLVVETVLFFQEVSIINFLTDTQWTPTFAEKKEFGIFVLASATLLVTVIAIIVAIPMGLLAAIYLSEYASPQMRRFLKPALEALSGIPTVVYGYFALLFLTPLLKETVFPDLSAFNGLSAGIMVGVLITPIISSLSEDALGSIPADLRQGGYALGFTKAEVILKIVIPAALPGIISSFTLAVSRALGETIIVAIAAGQFPNLTLNPFVPIETMTTFIIQVSLGTVQFGSLDFKTIFTVGMALFLITLIFNSLSYWLLRRNQQQALKFMTPQTTLVDTNAATAVEPCSATSLTFTPEFNPTPSGEPSFHSQPYRFWLDRIFENLSLVAAFSGVLVLMVLFFDLAQTGLPRLSLDFLNSFASRRPEESGILAPLTGTVWLFILTGVFVFPIGVGGAIYLEEYQTDTWFNRSLEVIIANLAAVPSILYGLLGLELFVRLCNPVTGGYSILAAALTLTVVALPTLIIASRTALRTVPESLRQGGYGLGMNHWQMLRYVVIPSALPAIFTGTLLSLSRVIGATAPLLAVGAAASVRFVPPLSWEGLQSQYTTLPVQIFYWLQNPNPGVQANAAAATIVLVMMLLVVNVVAVLLRDLYERRIA
jgi:phosphate transport system permease protein